MDSSAKKRDLKKGSNETCNHAPLALVSPSERRDYGEDRVINLDV